MKLDLLALGLSPFVTCLGSCSIHHETDAHLQSPQHLVEVVLLPSLASSNHFRHDVLLIVHIPVRGGERRLSPYVKTHWQVGWDIEVAATCMTQPHVCKHLLYPIQALPQLSPKAPTFNLTFQATEITADDNRPGCHNHNLASPG